MEIAKHTFFRFEKKLNNLFLIFNLEKGKIYKGSRESWHIFRELKKHSTLFEFLSSIESKYNQTQFENIKKFVISLKEKNVILLNSEEEDILKRK